MCVACCTIQGSKFSQAAKAASSFHLHWCGPLSFLFNHLIQLAQWIFPAWSLGRTSSGLNFALFGHFHNVCPLYARHRRTWWGWRYIISFYPLARSWLVCFRAVNKKRSRAVVVVQCKVTVVLVHSHSRPAKQPPSAVSTLLASLAVFPTRDICLINFENWAGTTARE